MDLYKPVDEFEVSAAGPGSGGGPGCAFRRNRSTHTFMIHLGDCAEGSGETVFLSHLGAGEPAAVLGAVLPRRGRLVIFPHECPHAGLPVTEAYCKLQCKCRLFLGLSIENAEIMENCP